MPPPSEAGLILVRFPGPVTLRSSRKKWLTLLLFCGLAAAGGLALARSDVIEGWFLAVFFGALAILCLGMLLPGASTLTLDAAGFEVTKFFRSRRARWRDVKRFDTFELQRGWAARLFTAEKLVVYDDVAARAEVMAMVNTSLADHNAYLPDTYGLPADELAWLMTQWRARASGLSRT